MFDTHSPETGLYTIAEYGNFIRRRWRFILVGTMTVGAAMGVVSLVQHDVYSAWAVIDAGTVGARRGANIDVFRNRFNGGGYRAAIADFPPGQVTKAWIDFIQPNVFLRVDAVDGPTAAVAAKRLADDVLVELAKIPVLPLRASPRDTRAILTSIQRLEQWTSEKLTVARAARPRLTADRTVILEEMNSRYGRASLEDWKSLVDRLSTVIEARAHADQDVRRLEAAAVDLHAARTAIVLQAAVPQLRRLLETPPHSVDDLVIVVGLTKMLLGTPMEPPLISARLTAAPQVPMSPARPKRTLNLLIASLFGLVGSTLAALLLEDEAPNLMTLRKWRGR